MKAKLLLLVGLLATACTPPASDGYCDVGATECGFPQRSAIYFESGRVDTASGYVRVGPRTRYVQYSTGATVRSTERLTVVPLLPVTR